LHEIFEDTMTTQPFAIPALLFLLAAVPLALGLVPRNRFFGFRTSKTLSDEGVWYAVNRVAGASVMAASGVYGAVAVARPYSQMASLSRFGLHLAAFALPLVAALGLARWYAKRF
jgi:uncharacterized membrane protein